MEIAEIIPRPRDLARIEELFDTFPVVGLVGPRQVGKTTLARRYASLAERPTTFFDLEDPADAARLSDPGLVLRPLEGLVILDEIQLRPDLFAILRVLADRPEKPARFLVLGSASLDVMRSSAESLAGRIGYHRLSGFDLADVGPENADELWLRGSFPLAYLAPTLGQSAEWRRQFVTTFLQRDVPQWGVGIPAATLRRFWTMVAHYHGQTLNFSELARSFGVNDMTVRSYVDLLADVYMVRLLQPWHANISKRQVKSPKLFFEDSGIFHTLLGLESRSELEVHPKLGASWEGFAMHQVISALGARLDEVYFWATHAGAELDLFVLRGNRRLGFEFKRTETPRTTKSMHSAMRDLELERLDVIHAGPHTFGLTEDIRALSIYRLLDDLEPLGAGR